MAMQKFSQQESTKLVCKACKQEVQATVVYEVIDVIAHPEGGAATAQLQCVGVKIDHDCIPPVTRGDMPRSGSVSPYAL